ncbi:MAG: ADOP family duplicated permease [Vicinamibacteraceae bacterium]
MSLSFRLALRSLRAAPVFTVTALATLALCLGATVTIFALVDAVLLRPLPYRDADRLVTISHAYSKLSLPIAGASLTSYYERRGRIPALASLAALDQAASLVGETGATSREPIGRVTPEFFTTLGVTPLLGRVFTEGELTYQTDHVAMLTYEYWQRQYGGDPRVLDRAVRIDGILRRIVGVLPPGFRYLSFDAPVYLPLSSEEGERNIGARHSAGKTLIGRLRPGATLAEAQAQIDAHDRAHAAEFPEPSVVADAGFHSIVAPLHAQHVDAVRLPLLLLQAGALVLLAIGSVNLVNLWLVRATGRTRDRAIRQALGAGRRDLALEVAVEALLIAVAGALLGVVAADFGVRGLVLLGADHLPLGARLALDARVVAAAVAAAVTVGAAVALPVMAFTRRGRLLDAMRSESRSVTAGAGVERLRHGFIVAQIALSFVLLAGASLLGVSLWRAMAVPPGFRTDGTTAAQFTLPWSGYHETEAFVRFFDRLLTETGRQPGVSAVGVVTLLPVSGGRDTSAVSVEGRTAPPGSPVAVPTAIGIGGDYFRAMGVPLVAGRYLDASDARRRECTCVVDDAFAHREWPQGRALGGRIHRGSTPGPDVQVCTVVGVVAPVKLGSPTDDAGTGVIYYSWQNMRSRTYYLVVRSGATAEALAPTLARLVRGIDPELPLTDVRSMDTRLADSLQSRRTPALVAGLFALAALLLAAVGLYGVMAYAVAARVNEFGIRMALGALRGDVLRLVLAQGGRLVASGLALGLVVALWATTLMSHLLFGVDSTSPLALGGVGLLLVSVAAVACAVPAVRAARVTPLVALRK